MSGLSYNQILIGRVMTGLVGLTEVLNRFADEGLPADSPGLGKRLVDAVAENNYVPRSALLEYTASLLREYRLHLEARSSGESRRAWSDPHRKHVPWYPTIFASKCDGCGRCIKACPNGVLGWDEDKNKALVWQPYACAPGCTICAQACQPKAIVMPPRQVLHQRLDAPGQGGATSGASPKLS